MSAKKYIAAILGGSGSVGKQVLKSILADPQCDQVILISRRKLDDLKSIDPERITVQVCDPLDDIGTNANLSGTNVAFCTLGHGSSRKSTKDDLVRVDATIPGEFAKACRKAGVTHYCIMTAAGSDENAKWSSLTKTAAGGGWYNHVKGVAEKLTIDAGIPYTYISQPAALLGSPHTPKLLEFIPNFILPALYSSAHVADIAKGMVATTINAYQQNKTGVVKVTGGIPISEGRTE
uniref:NAD(P)-binding domain-containing protein n=1 Tax=Pseudo-nitzschia australis TaxID=44445 RepID=A0A7S4AWU9_9STRA|mmetsp:Transcript_10640/g.21045  ORF Transcript_10640/g.21045 Transcript_10640/m.21045 type:complete len:235 (+) Transcript_10640:87-791(+)|eukprot:CAMPEP_0168295680 /NCGR_PEP_ID=MMETSP0142_2-20121227/13080_1 /TAXON_ID=44445 /ORGANISM="Pseudo-nitzschia australis, Strain 10249 10 AB" /LENGTH=234 /DNA_ID=CAMNT_0008244435 /DNA_START=16 /DNA_END=720 /DNA_ORIENTATION=-